jgi:ABC-type branched-subunit amino acid transport system permease subunit
LSLVLVTGYTGQITLVQWLLAGAGAFIAAFLAVNYHWPLLGAMVVGGLSAAAIALVVVGLPALRLRGVSLAILTLSVGIAIQITFLGEFNQGAGYIIPNLGFAGTTLTGRSLTIFSVVTAAILTGLMYLFSRSRLALSLFAVRSSERAALSCGVHAFRVKLVVFTTGGLLAGLGGVIWAMGVQTVQSASFDPITSLSLVAFVFLNGIGSIAGGLAAGVAIAAGPAVLSTFIHVNGASWFQVLGGVGLIATMILHPNGAFVRVDVPKKDRKKRFRLPATGPLKRLATPRLQTPGVP